MAESERLIEAMRLLAPNMNLTGRHALVAALLEQGSTPTPTSSDPVTTELVNVAASIYELIDGGVFVHEFVDKLWDFIASRESGGTISKDTADKVRQFVRVTCSGVAGDAGSLSPNSAVKEKISMLSSSVDALCMLNDRVNYDLTADPKYSELTLSTGGIKLEGATTDPSGSPARELSSLVCIELLNPRLGISNRDSSAVAAFTSFATPVEMSRCVPFVDIRISTSSSLAQDTTSPAPLSLVSFLGGPDMTLGRGTADSFMSYTSDGQQRPVGMEIFTSPQTLSQHKGPTTLDDDAPAIFDRFRPFMSLKGLSLSVAATKGMMSYKSGKLDVVVHDRSRLGLVANMIRPGLYQGTELDIEYGWSGPGGRLTDVSRSPIAVLLDSMRVIEKYSIVNSSMNFDEAGQANISLTIAMKGIDSIMSADISMCSNTAATALASLVSEVSELIDRERSQDAGRFGRLFNETLMSAASSSESALAVDPVKLKELRTKIQSIKRRSGLGSLDIELAQKLDELFKSSGALDDFKQSADAAVKKELAALANGVEIFPCSDGQIGSRVIGGDVVVPAGDSGYGDRIVNPVSLGRVLAAFVGKTLVSTGRFDEIQFVFHTFNEKASFMRDLSIAKFPISMSDLESAVKDIAAKNIKVGVMQFVAMLNDRFVGNPASQAYGFRTLYKIDKETGDYVRKESETESGTAALVAKEDAIIKSSGINNGIFRLPKLAMYPECVLSKSDPAKSILRLHVIDETTSAFETYNDLLRATSDVDLTQFGLLDEAKHPILSLAPELAPGPYGARKSDLLKQLQDAGVVSFSSKSSNPSGVELEADVDPSKLLVGKSISDVKRFVSRGLPTILFGRSGGAVMEAGLGSLNDPRLTTVNIINNDRMDASKPDNSRSRGLPMQIMPTECTVKMLGCPLLSFGQYFFVDFNTNTTADNIYAVTSLDHSIENGSFLTTAKLTMIDAYAKYTSMAKKLTFASNWIASSLGQAKQPTPPPATTTTTAAKAQGTPPAFLTSLGLLSFSTELKEMSLDEHSLVIAVVIDKESMSTVTVGSRPYIVVPSGQTIRQLSLPSSLDSSVAIVIVPLAPNRSTKITGTVYNYVGFPSQSDAASLAALGTVSGTSITFDSTDWAALFI